MATGSTGNNVYGVKCGKTRALNFSASHNYLKCYYDQILDIHFFTFSHTIGVSKISCQISIYYEQQNSCFLNLSFRESTAAINFPCSKSGLRMEKMTSSQKYRTG